MDVLNGIRELQHQIEHAKVAKQYKQAQALEDELQQLKQVQEDRQLQDLLRQQAQELQACDREYEEAVQQLMDVWSGNMSELQHQLQQGEQQLLSRHEEETATLLATQAAYPARPKFSPALLNMRHIEHTLAEQKEFDKADKVRKQADQLEQMELSQMGSDRAARIEVEQTRLASQQSREVEAAAQKANSAVLAAQQRQEYEVEQLTRRFQAVKLALTRAHAAQRITLQQNLRGSLGLKKPSKLLGLPSFNSSLTETRGLVPEPAPKAASRQASAGPISPTVRSSGSGRCDSLTQGLDTVAETYSHAGSGRCRSPLGSPDRAATASPTGSNRKASGVLCNPERAMHYDPYEHGPLAVPGGTAGNGVWDPSPVLTRRKTIAAADAAAAAAGLGLTMPSLSGTSAKATAASAKGRKAMKPSSDTRPYTSAASRPSGQHVPSAAAGTVAGGSFPACSTAVRPETRAAARQPSPPKRPAAGSCALAGSAQATAPACATNTSRGGAGSAGIGALRPTTRRGPVEAALPATVLINSSSHGSIHSSSSGVEPWASTPGAPPLQPSAGGYHRHGLLEHAAQNHLLDHNDHAVAAPAAPAASNMGSTAASHSASVNTQDSHHSNAASSQLNLHKQGSGQEPHDIHVAAAVDAVPTAASSLPEAASGSVQPAAAQLEGDVAGSYSDDTFHQEQVPAAQASQDPAAAVPGELPEQHYSDEDFERPEMMQGTGGTSAEPARELEADSAGEQHDAGLLSSAVAGTEAGEQHETQQAVDPPTEQLGAAAAAGAELSRGGSYAEKEESIAATFTDNHGESGRQGVDAVGQPADHEAQLRADTHTTAAVEPEQAASGGVGSAESSSVET